MILGLQRDLARRTHAELGIESHAQALPQHRVQLAVIDRAGAVPIKHPEQSFRICRTKRRRRVLSAFRRRALVTSQQRNRPAHWQHRVH